MTKKMLGLKNMATPNYEDLKLSQNSKESKKGLVKAINPKQVVKKVTVSVKKL